MKDVALFLLAVGLWLMALYLAVLGIEDNDFKLILAILCGIGGFLAFPWPDPPRRSPWSY
jgi:hypothetical protein